MVWVGAMLLAGECHGGPLGGKRLLHGETVYNVGRDRITKRLIIGRQGGPTEDVEIGHYEYSGGGWHWHSPSA